MIANTIYRNRIWSLEFFLNNLLKSIACNALNIYMVAIKNKIILVTKNAESLTKDNITYSKLPSIIKSSFVCEVIIRMTTLFGKQTIGSKLEFVGGSN